MCRPLVSGSIVRLGCEVERLWDWCSSLNVGIAYVNQIDRSSRADSTVNVFLPLVLTQGLRPAFSGDSCRFSPVLGRPRLAPRSRRTLGPSSCLNSLVCTTFDFAATSATSNPGVRAAISRIARPSGPSRKSSRRRKRSILNALARQQPIGTRADSGPSGDWLCLYAAGISCPNSPAEKLEDGLTIMNQTLGKPICQAGARARPWRHVTRQLWSEREPASETAISGILARNPRHSRTA